MLTELQPQNVMETEKLNQNVDSTMDLSDDQSLNVESSDAYDVFDEPELVPRVDDEYQVEIPALVTGPEYDHYLKSPIDVENRGHVLFDFWRGLSVPVTWNKNVNKVSEVLKNGEQDFSGHSNEAFNSSAPLKFESVKEKMDPYQGSCNFLVPGVCGDIWNGIEVESFLLGLYIFGKEFSQLKRFVGSKKMEDILLLYYGRFYSSVEFTRWTKITKRRKVKSKKWAYGQRMFSGLRLEELLSRILPQVSEECKKELTEVSAKFADVCISLEDYVSSLKAIVGLKTFIEAVALGKGKKDLTSMASGLLHPKVPIDKPYSSLTRTEIIDILTGGDRLSKAKASNLFWEAVWPRLLDRGWQSEKPKNQAYVPGANNSLVFLTPGVKKFSNSRLVKGTHYYVSVTDILSKVVSEPELLKLDTEKDGGMKKDEDGWVDMNNVQEKLPEKRHCYLQPRTPNRDMDVIKFTVVDTSLANGEFFRELRTLPKDVLKMKSFSEDSDNGTSEVSTNGSDCAYNMFVNQETKSTTSEKNLSERSKTLDSSSSDQHVQIRGPDSLKLVKKSQPNKLYGDKQTRKPVKSHLSQKSKRKNLDSLASATKRHRTILACSNEEMGSGRITLPLVTRLGEDAHGFCTDNHDPNDKEVGSSQDRLSFTISPKGSSPQSTEGAQKDDCHGPENPQSRPIIDLNLPQQPVEFEDGIFMTDSTNMQNDITSKQNDDLCVPKTSVDIGVLEHPININSRRQSTRNRPPTARALEALVNGYLTATTRRKDAHEASRSRPPKRSRREVAATDITTHDAVRVGESGTGMIDAGNINTFDKLQVLSNENGPHISNP